VQALYTNAVCEQLRAYGPALTALGYVPRYLYWGGGTPSSLSAGQITQIASATARAFDLGGVSEATVESSPETLTSSKLFALLDSGFNRLSIGVQSFIDDELRHAGRAHSAEQAADAFKLAREAGFSNINLDFIAGFPNQTETMLDATIERCCALEPDHVTLYVYSDSAPTVMARQIQEGKRSRNSYAERAELFHRGQAALLAAGYREYMPMYFARDGASPFMAEDYYFQLRGDHFGFGSGAHSSVGHHLLSNHRGGLGRYISDPTTFDSAIRYLPDTGGLSLILSRMAFNVGSASIDFHRFQQRFGFRFKDVWDHEAVRDWRASMTERGAELKETAAGLEICWPNARVRLDESYEPVVLRR
jgi:oxygen-independent coproporphyrinogen-3 oxidase